MNYKTKELSREVLLDNSTIYTYIHDGSQNHRRFFLTFPDKDSIEVSRIDRYIPDPSTEEIYSVSVASEIVYQATSTNKGAGVPNGVLLKQGTERVPEGNDLAEKFPEEITFFRVPDGMDLYREALKLISEIDK